MKVQYEVFYKNRFQAWVAINSTTLSGFGATKEEAKSDILPYSIKSLAEQAKAISDYAKYLETGDE